MRNDNPLKPYDAGLQPERTALSWIRTALCFVVNAVLLIRSGLIHQVPLITAAGGILLAGSIGVAVLSLLRQHHFSGPQPYGVSQIWPPLFCIAFTACASLMGVISAILTYRG
jgi:uncharacterized membrane protein YidH (DUF202 family)